MPLQSGNSSSPNSALFAESSNFFIQFCRAVFQKEVANTRLIHIYFVHLHQTYHIIGVFYNASAVAVLDRVTFERQQVPQRNDLGAGRTGGGGHGVGCELGEGLIPDEHQIKRQELSVRRVELKERRAFTMKRITRAAHQLRPKSPIRSTDDKVNIESVARVTMGNHRVSAGQHERQPSLRSLNGDGSQCVHFDRWLLCAWAAAIKPLNSGCGWCGLLRNSG